MDFDEKAFMAMSNLQNRLVHIRKLLENENINHIRILEVGCGPGLIGASFLENHCEVHGLDMDEKALEIATQKGLIVKLLNIEKNAFPYASEFFDLVIISEVIEHIIEYHHVLDEIYRVLKKNGIVILTTPNLNSTENMFKLLRGKDVLPIYSRECTSKHLRLFSGDSLRTLFWMHAFQTVNVDYVNYPPKSVLGYLKKLLCFFFPQLGVIILFKAYKR